MRHRSLGLTLIEMMLVVTVFAVATLTTIKLIQNRAAGATADAVAAQMENVAQGVLAFYMYQSTRIPKSGTSTYNYNICSWPTTVNCSYNNTLYPKGLNLETLAPQFYPLATLCTPFYKSSSSGACGKASEISGQPVSNTTYFQLVVQTNSDDMAAAIAARLANAVATNNIVTMTLIAPNQNYTMNINHGWIVSAGAISFSPYPGASTALNVSAPASVILPNCGNNFEGHVIFMPFRYQTTGTAQTYWGMHIAQLTPQGSITDSSNLSSGNSVVFEASPPDSHGNSAYAVTLGDLADIGSNAFQTVRHMAYYITFCLPQGHWQANGLDQGGLTGWQQDGACNPTWRQFVNAIYTTSPSPYDNMCTSSANTSGQPNFSSPIGNPNAS